jgi:hypothetical protein
MFYSWMLITTVPFMAFCKSLRLFFIIPISALNLSTYCILKMSKELGSSILRTGRKSGTLASISLAILSPI